MLVDQEELVAMPQSEPGRDVAGELRRLVGDGVWARLLEARKITGLPVMTTLARAVDTYARLAKHELNGFAIQLVTDTETRPFRLDE